MTTRYIGLCILSLVVSMPAVSSVAQSPNTLESLIPVDGQIEPGGSQSWAFSAQSGAVISVVAEAVTQGFDPVLTIQGADGTNLIDNDDYDYPNSRDALLEAITLPRTGDYSVSVSGFGDSSGKYRLTLFPGFVQIASIEHFDEAGSWATGHPTLGLDVADGELALSLTGVSEYGAAFNATSVTLRDFYAQVRVTQVAGRNGWIAGMALRGQTDRYYLLAVSSQGAWRFMLQTPEGRHVVRTWTPHPAIVPGETSFTLGVLANGSQFDVFYNGQYIGQATDGTLVDPGRVGLVAGAVDAVGSETTAHFDDLVATVPDLIDGKTIPPDRLIVSGGTSMGLELQRRFLVPPGGMLALTLPESSARNNRPGVTRFVLGRGTTYTNFAFGANVTVQAAGDGMAGCGLIMRSVDDTHYLLAYIDQTGSYGLAQRDGDGFLPGIFGQNTDVQRAAARHLLVIANGETTRYYLDGKYVGSLDSPEVAGEIGNAVVNFEAIDTSCQFNDTWLWSW